MARLLLAKRGLVAGITETVIGTDPWTGSPVVTGASSGALQVRNFNPTLNGEPVNRDLLLSHLDKLGSVVGVHWIDLEFETEWAGTGVIPDATTNKLREDFLYRSCGWVPTYVASTSATYAPTSDPYPTTPQTCTLYTWLDGLRVRLVGCRGNLRALGGRGQFPSLGWRMRGALGAISSSPAGTDAIIDQNIPSTIAYQAKVPFPFLGVSFTLHGFACKFTQFEYDEQNVVEEVEDCGSPSGIESFFIGDRDPMITVDPQMALRADWDAYGKWKNNATGAIVLSFGSGAGNVCGFNAPKTQHRNPPPMGVRGTKRAHPGLQMSALANSDNGNDHATFSYT